MVKWTTYPRPSSSISWLLTIFEIIFLFKNSKNWTFFSYQATSLLNKLIYFYSKYLKFLYTWKLICTLSSRIKYPISLVLWNFKSGVNYKNWPLLMKILLRKRLKISCQKSASQYLINFGWLICNLHVSYINIYEVIN